MSLILKPDRDQDLYVDWSTIADGMNFAGNREAMLEHLHSGLPSGRTPEQRLAYVDQYGTSAIWPVGASPAYGWDDTGLVVMSPHMGWLPRAKLLLYVLAMLNQAEDRAAALLEPLDDE